MSRKTRESAIAWIRDNPVAMGFFEHFARQMMKRGKRFGINLLRERVRWEAIYQYDSHAYKFTNQYSPYVARYLISKFPQLAHHMQCNLTKDEVARGRIMLIDHEDIDASRTHQ